MSASESLRHACPHCALLRRFCGWCRRQQRAPLAACAHPCACRPGKKALGTPAAWPQPAHWRWLLAYTREPPLSLPAPLPAPAGWGRSLASSRAASSSRWRWVRAWARARRSWWRPGRSAGCGSCCRWGRGRAGPGNGRGGVHPLAAAQPPFRCAGSWRVVRTRIAGRKADRHTGCCGGRRHDSLPPTPPTHPVAPELPPAAQVAQDAGEASGAHHRRQAPQGLPAVAHHRALRRVPPGHTAGRRGQGGAAGRGAAGRRAEWSTGER